MRRILPFHVHRADEAFFGQFVLPCLVEAAHQSPIGRRYLFVGGIVPRGCQTIELVLKNDSSPFSVPIDILEHDTFERAIDESCSESALRRSVHLNKADPFGAKECGFAEVCNGKNIHPVRQELVDRYAEHRSPEYRFARERSMPEINAFPKSGVDEIDFFVERGSDELNTIIECRTREVGLLEKCGSRKISYMFELGKKKVCPLKEGSSCEISPSMKRDADEANRFCEGDPAEVSGGEDILIKVHDVR